ncbi:MAG: PQQ-binding-like beta-propeller repeat protein [Verrucomicrobiae bacterium]|nr:PQQ-binding-like beta-propeller repeat protein [Verrucomicrobiae bacterium]
MLVGDYQNDDAATNGGAAHLYDARTGRYLRKLLPADLTESSIFGNSVALSGQLAVVGTVFGGGGVYGFDARTGRQLWKIDSVVDSFGFGFDVAVSGQTLLVGAPFSMDGGQSGAGLAYVYDLSGPMPILLQTLSRGVDVAQDSRFGGSVALCGPLALVGCADNNGSSSGFAYLFDAASGVRLQKWTDPDLFFGASVAVEAGRVVVGSRGSGEVRVFDPDTGAEEGYSPIAVPDLGTSNTVSVSGNLLLIGEKTPIRDRAALLGRRACSTW